MNDHPGRDTDVRSRPSKSTIEDPSSSTDFLRTQPSPTPLGPAAPVAVGPVGLVPVGPASPVLVGSVGRVPVGPVLTCSDLV